MLAITLTSLSQIPDERFVYGFDSVMLEGSKNPSLGIEYIKDVHASVGERLVKIISEGLIDNSIHHGPEPILDECRQRIYSSIKTII